MVQGVLRCLFERWGLPARIRVDNGAPWSTWADVPAALALWWVGLGIEPIFNHIHCPKENTFVERCNGLIDPWGEPSGCANFADWQQKLSWVEQTQREVYPAKEGKSRLATYPALLGNPRTYSIAQEPTLWQIARVRAYLAQGRWPRLVSKIGQITLYGRAYSIGHKYAHQQAWVSLDPTTNEWVVQQEDGTEIGRRQAEQITAECICGLKVAHPRPPSIKKKRQNLIAQK